MNLQDMSVGLLRQVIAVYEQEAWGDQEFNCPDMEGADTACVTEALGRFIDETQAAGGGTVHRYALRLGNPRYPFMKLVLQEHLVQGEYFFEVDTHDGMFDLESDPDSQRLQELRRYNLSVKERVEQALLSAGLPTSMVLQGLIETLPTERIEPNGFRILLVDDDICIAKTLATLLRGRGYEVEVLHDGIDAVETADGERHDLILMDNEMPQLNGFVACRVLKSRPETKDIPVLIATAGSLTLEQLDQADGFLVKPFRIELLLSMLDHMLGRRSSL
ncbi:MAG: CheY-like chemotaxis protein [Pseudohongiellaceae bacterium]|jgi:CheY-like chemotaxis protein